MVAASYYDPLFNFIFTIGFIVFCHLYVHFVCIKLPLKRYILALPHSVCSCVLTLMYRKVYVLMCIEHPL